mgnify:FL=1
MASAPNMKVRATMDNSDLKKKSQESKAALRDFEKAGTDAASKLGEAFGVNTGKIEQMVSSLRGLGEKMTESGNAGTAAFGKILTSINGLSAGLAGLGIGAVVAGFKLLSSEAENFKNTVAGANMELATQAYIDTYRQVIHDFNRELGEGFAKTESGWKKFWGTIGSAMKAGIQTGAIGSAPGDFNSYAFQNYAELTDKAAASARTALEISNEIYDTQRRLSDASVEWARMEAEIAEYKRIAYDSTASLADRQNAINKAAELINQRYGEEAELRKKLADLQAEMNSLAESSVADVDKANQLRVQEFKTTVAMDNALRELAEKQKTITQEVQKEVQARLLAAALAQQQATDAADTAGARAQMSEFTASIKPVGLEMNFPKLEIPAIIKPEIDTNEIEVETLSAVTSAFEGISASIGNLIVDLASGENAWENFGTAALSSFADMAITIGKLALATGLAASGIIESLKLNPVVAIAAGAALIALGSAVKAGLSNVAAGNYNASTNVASATGNYGAGSSPINTAFENREMTIKVTGTLRAEGSQLVSVIENERTRLAHTT